jgi:hypothetical protein
MARLYRCPRRGGGCNFEGRGRKLKRHMQRSQCHLYCEDFVFLRPDQIWYNGERLLSYGHVKMYVYHLGEQHFSWPFEGYQKLMLQSELDTLHYLEVRQTRARFAFDLTTGFARQYAHRLDAVFVLSPTLISDWHAAYQFTSTNPTKWTHRRHTQQTANVKYTRKELMRFSNLYILLILNRNDYAHDIVDLFRHSEALQDGS